MLMMPSPPLVPQVIDVTAAIAPRATPNIKVSPVPRHRARPRGGGLRARFLPALMALQLAAVAAVLLARVEVVRVMPEAASLFRMVGLPVNLRGLVFAGLGTRTEQQDGVAVLIVEGRIESDSHSAASVPPLRFALRDAAGVELYAWTVPSDAATIGPGESLPFQARMISPLPGGNDVLVRFAHPSDGLAAPPGSGGPRGSVRSAGPRESPACEPDIARGCGAGRDSRMGHHNRNGRPPGGHFDVLGFDAGINETGWRRPAFPGVRR